MTRDEFLNRLGELLACLPPIAGCSDGMPLSWPVSTSPDAGMDSPSLTGACK